MLIHVVLGVRPMLAMGDQKMRRGVRHGRPRRWYVQALKGTPETFIVIESYRPAGKGFLVEIEWTDRKGMVHLVRTGKASTVVNVKQALTPFAG